MKEVYRPRSKNREFIQLARIIRKEPKTFHQITRVEAIEDGFGGLPSMFDWLKDHHKEWDASKPINKLTMEVIHAE